MRRCGDHRIRGGCRRSGPFGALGGRGTDLGAFESHYLHYASPTGQSVAPYLTWETAAVVLLDAVDAAHDGDTVLAAEGDFQAESPWLLSAVPLDFGVNPIQVSGESASGVWTEDWVWVTRVMRPDSGNSPEHFVSLDGGEVWPYTNWVGATRQPQRALNAAVAGDRVRVVAGHYYPGAEVKITNALHFCVGKRA